MRLLIVKNIKKERNKSDTCSRIMDQKEQDSLAILQTLLALERNFLAEERTCLAEFRTGLGFTVLGPTIGTILAYLFSSLALEDVFLYDLMNFIFFSIITVLGIWITLHSRSKLKKIRNLKKSLKVRQSDIIKTSKSITNLLGDCICLDFFEDKGR